MNHTTPLMAALAGVAIVGTALAGNAQGLPIPRVAIEGRSGIRAVVDCQSGRVQLFHPDGNAYHHQAQNGARFHKACVLFNQPVNTQPTYEL